MNFLDFELDLDGRRRIRVVDLLGELLKIRRQHKARWIAVQRHLVEPMPATRLQLQLRAVLTAALQNADVAGELWRSDFAMFEEIHADFRNKFKRVGISLRDVQYILFDTFFVTLDEVMTLRLYVYEYKGRRVTLNRGVAFAALPRGFDRVTAESLDEERHSVRLFPESETDLRFVIDGSCWDDLAELQPPVPLGMGRPPAMEAPWIYEACELAGKFFGVTPTDPDVQFHGLCIALEACRLPGHVMVLPELSVPAAAIPALQAHLAASDTPPLVLVMGSAHVLDDGGRRRNRIPLLVGSRIVGFHDKWHPDIRAPNGLMEEFDPTDAVVQIWAGPYLSFTALFASDFADLQIGEVLRLVGPNLILCPGHPLPSFEVDQLRQIAFNQGERTGAAIGMVSSEGPGEYMFFYPVSSEINELKDVTGWEAEAFVIVLD